MKQIDFNEYVRNKLNLEVGVPDNQKNLSEKTVLMNVIHNRLRMRQSDKGIKISANGSPRPEQTVRYNDTNTSNSSNREVRSNKIIHLNKFK